MKNLQNFQLDSLLPLAAMRVAARMRQVATVQRLSLYDWIMKYRQLDGQPLADYPIMHSIYADEHEFSIFKKSAQVFVSEYLINKAFWVADNKIGGRGNVLYAYPTQDKLNEFSHARVEKAIDESDYLRSKVRGINNVSLKRVGNAFIYFRGAQKRSNLLTMDVDLCVLDEFDEMMPNVLTLAEKRLGSSKLAWRSVASTPTYTGVGIDDLWDRSDQRWYVIPCNHCNWKQPLVWEQIDIDRKVYLCEHCHEPMDRFAVGEWITTKESSIHGYYISKLYSPLANLELMISASMSATEGELQEFYNSDLGMAYSPEGTTIGINELDACVNPEYDPSDRESVDMDNLGNCYMGVDVGNMLHVDIIEVLEDRERLVYSDTKKDFEELSNLVNSYNIKRVVVDIMPETRKAREFAELYKGRVALCRYIDKDDYDPKTYEVHANRTNSIDYTFSRIFHRRLELPYNARFIGGRMRPTDRFGQFYSHLMAPNRILYVDVNKNIKAKYDEAGKPDHHTHALTLSYIAADEKRYNKQWSTSTFLHLMKGMKDTISEIYPQEVQT